MWGGGGAGNRLPSTSEGLVAGRHAGARCLSMFAYQAVALRGATSSFSVRARVCKKSVHAVTAILSSSRPAVDMYMAGLIAQRIDAMNGPRAGNVWMQYSLNSPAPSRSVHRTSRPTIRKTTSSTCSTHSALSRSTTCLRIPPWPGLEFPRGMGNAAKHPVARVCKKSVEKFRRVSPVHGPPRSTVEACHVSFFVFFGRWVGLGGVPRPGPGG